MRIFIILLAFALISCNGNTGEKKETTEKVQPSTTTKRSTSKSTSINNAVTDDNGVKKFTMKNPNDAKTAASSKPRTPAVNKRKKISSKTTLPDPCELMNADRIARLMDVPAQSININDGTGGDGMKSRACFFKWDEPNIKNAGAMVQVQLNPVPDEVPDYFTYFVDSKISDGEKDFNRDQSIKFKRWKHVGTSGAYSNELGKYIWRVNNEYCFMIAFNTGRSDAEKMKAAKALSKDVMKKMGL